MFELWDRLGARRYYYGQRDWRFLHLFDHAVYQIPESDRVIDPVAVHSILTKNYILGDRTVVSGLHRTPWMARPAGGFQWQFADLPRHGDNRHGADIIAGELCRRLYTELLEYLEGSDTVGVLLSGGMDSRVVAGLVRMAQLAGDYSGDVVALNWGLRESRDAVYSEYIARRFGWEYIRFSLNAELLYSNIHLAAARGAEYSPVHLHAMEKISNISALDCIIAGSFGDSVGRGEYSSRHISRHPFILARGHNRYEFLRKPIQHNSWSKLFEDVNKCRAAFGRSSEREYRELDLQRHYMSRMLCPCMEVIDDKIPLYQMFTHPDVYGYMWSLDMSVRTDHVYSELFKILPKDLCQIPWARTGRIYGSHNSAVDKYCSMNNKYGSWSRKNCRDFVVREIGDGALQSLNIFNNYSLDFLCKLWPRSDDKVLNRLDERMVWLASLSILIKHYKVKGIESESKSTLYDRAYACKGAAHGYLYSKLYSSKTLRKLSSLY